MVYAFKRNSEKASPHLGQLSMKIFHFKGNVKILVDSPHAEGDEVLRIPENKFSSQPHEILPQYRNDNLLRYIDSEAHIPAVHFSTQI